MAGTPAETPTPTPAPDASETPASGTPAVDTSYDDAFAAAATEGEETPPAAETPPASETPPAKDGEQETPPAEGGGETPPAKDGEQETPPAKDGEQETPPAKDGEQAPPAKEGEPKTPPAASPDDVVTRLADLLEQRREKPGEQTPAAEQQAPPFTEAEQKILTDYKQNWPDVAQAEALHRRAEYHDLLKFIFTEVAGQMAPIQETLRAVGNTMHTTELRAAVPDYSENLEADVTSWIDTQPSYLQTGMKQVMQSGTSDEVADLIGRYREANGTPKAQADGQQTPPPAPKDVPKPPAKTELSSAAKQAAESLAPVSGERTQVPAGEDPGDFDTAFAKYAAAEKV
jgi:hypothetical protein